MVEVERVDDESRSGASSSRRTVSTAAAGDGQRIAVEARLDRPLGFRNPGTFDYAEHLLRRGIVVVGTVRAERILALDEREPRRGRRALKRQAVAAMREALPPVSAALLAGLLLGERTELPADVDAAFRRAGVYHVLAVSGFNVALVASTVWALLALARAPRRVAALGALVVVAGVRGRGRPAALGAPRHAHGRPRPPGAPARARGLRAERPGAGRRSPSWPSAPLTCTTPASSSRSPPRPASYWRGVPGPPRAAGWSAAVWRPLSAAAQLAVLPISLTHFNQLSTIGVLANLGVVPLAGLATVLGLVAVAAGLVSAALASWLFTAAWPILLLLRGVVAAAAAVPGAVIHVPAPGPLAIAGYVGALGLGLIAWRLRETRLRLARRLAIGRPGDSPPPAC